MSATPNWTADDQGDSTEILDAGGDPVGRIYRSDDADLIVRAVNAHDALVEVARAAEVVIDNEIPLTGEYEDVPTSWPILRVALAKAKEVL